MCDFPWLRKKANPLKKVELLSLTFPRQGLSNITVWNWDVILIERQGARGSSASGKRLLLLGSTSCTTLLWSNMKAMFPWQSLAFQGWFIALSYLLSGVSLSLAGSSHSALGNRRQGTLFPTLIRQTSLQEIHFPLEGFFFLFLFLWSCMSSFFFVYLFKRSNMPRLTTVVN